jgi:hypothetical protein
MINVFYLNPQCAISLLYFRLYHVLFLTLYSLTRAYDGLLYAKTIVLIALAAVALLGTTISIQHVFARVLPLHSNFSINFDNSGKPLSGANNYTVHFIQPPPSFSLSSWIKNNTYYTAIASPPEQVKKNTDGSLDIYVQHQSPATDKMSNWLKSPKDSFHLLLTTPARTWPYIVQRTG